MADKSMNKVTEWLLVDRGFNVEAKNSLERAALHRAAELEQEEVVRLLLERGVDVEAKDDYERTAPLQAAEGGLWGR